MIEYSIYDKEMRGRVMINLFIAATKETWESNPTIFYKDRALTEYIQPEYRAKYGSFSSEAITAIKKMPCLFACESSERQDVYIGHITDISMRSNSIKIRYDLTGDYIRFEVFETLEELLDMGYLEQYRTHWTIKDVELSEIEPYFASGSRGSGAQLMLDEEQLSKVAALDVAAEMLSQQVRDSYFGIIDEEAALLQRLASLEIEPYIIDTDENTLFANLADTTSTVKRDLLKLNMDVERKTKLEKKKPVVFVSYCWSPPEHKRRVTALIEKLRNQGIIVRYDEDELQPGQDMNYFMESILSDTTIDHVLVVCNEEYAKRANARTSGAGYESGLILSEIRDDPKQTKYIPIILDRDADMKKCLPTFMRSRYCLNISDDDGFQRLIRAIVHPSENSKDTNS